MSSDQLEQIRSIASLLAEQIKGLAKDKPRREEYDDYKKWMADNRQWWDEALPMLARSNQIFSIKRMASVIGVSRNQLHFHLKKYNEQNGTSNG